MQKLVSAVFATILLATGSTLAIAQNSSTNTVSPAPTATASTNPDVATKRDLRRIEGTIAKTAKQQEANRKADADREAQQLKDLRAKEDAQVEADTKAMADQRAAQAQADAMRLHKLELEIATAVLVLGALFVIVIRKGLATIAMPSVPAVKEEIPEPAEEVIPQLPENASGEQMKDYLKRYPQMIGRTLTYVAIGEVRNPNNPEEKILFREVGRVEGFGTEKEFFFFGNRRGIRKDRHEAAKKNALQKQQGIHLVA